MNFEMDYSRAIATVIETVFAFLLIFIMAFGAFVLILSCKLIAFVWPIKIWVHRSQHKPPEKVQMKLKSIWNKALEIVILVSLLTPCNSFVAIDKKGNGFQSRSSRIDNL